jgi:hypothetical protein
MMFLSCMVGMNSSPDGKLKKLYPIAVGLQRRNDVLDCPFDEDTAYQSEALPIGILIKSFLQGCEDKAGRIVKQSKDGSLEEIEMRPYLCSSASDSSSPILPAMACSSLCNLV